MSFLRCFALSLLSLRHISSSPHLVSCSACSSYKATQLQPCMAPSPAASSSKPALKPPATNHNSLSSIVSQLVRSQYGTTAAQVKDDELDKHVAEMLLKEAREKEKAWGESKGGGYLSSGGEDK